MKCTKCGIEYLNAFYTDPLCSQCSEQERKRWKRVECTAVQILGGLTWKILDDSVYEDLPSAIRHMRLWVEQTQTNPEKENLFKISSVLAEQFIEFFDAYRSERENAEKQLPSENRDDESGR